MPSGTVKWFRKERTEEKSYGYGFITPDDGSKDVFVHISEVTKAKLDDLRENQRLCYDLENKNNKTSAVNIQLIDS